MSEILRPLSPIERWYWILDQTSPLNVIARVRLDGALEPVQLTAAATRLAARHPYLRVAIGDAGFVATANPIPVRSVRGSWQTVVDEAELAEAVDWRAGPLARIVHVPDGDRHDLLLVVSHVIADGTTALTLLRDLVQFAAGDAPAPLPDAGFPAPPEDLLPKAFRGKLGAARAMAMAVRGEAEMALARPRRLPAEVDVAPRQRRSRYLHRELDAQTVAGLVEACAAHSVSVHGALSAALAFAIGAEMDPGASGKLPIGSPVDFRDELSPPVGPDEAGAYVCTLPSVLAYGPDADFWAVAGATAADLRDQRARKNHFALISMLRLIVPKSFARSESTMRTVEQRGPGNICLSNIGRYDFPARIGDWTLTGAQFIAGISMSGYYVVTVNTSHDTLQWNVTYIDDVVSGARAQRITDATVELLRKVAAAG